MAESAVKECSMPAKKKGSDATGGSPDDLVSIKIKRKTHRKLRRLAAATDMEISAYLGRLVEKHFAEVWPELRDEP